ncbi:NAD(P)-binding protein [Westerdykella ornata]|uniref:NAD(P)-binding protein n=1 Tax=Westerdykella ornata TaxID=318751 RepID=A0A6A6JFH4_WESOR|nr:NAD(P)-binding protein [Westerdykella ornata]KAF2275370.1 NAD(P)-binding protein [Westerdykella ornata]
MSTRYAAAHAQPTGAGDARPTALQIIHDENLVNALADKVVLITGVSGGIGIETMRALHATGAHVFGTVRDLSKGQKVVSDILASNPNGGKIDLIEMDLGSLDSVRRGAQDFLDKSGGKLNLLILNAGIMAVPEGRTKDGFELQWGTNYVAHFLLFQLVKGALLESASPAFPSRVVSVSSLGHRYSSIRFHDYNFEREPYDKWLAYGQSKTGNIWLANAINRKYAGRNLYAVGLHPGVIMTGLAWALDEKEVAQIITPEATRMLKSPEQGAATSVLAAVGKEWRTVGGVWASDCAVQGRMQENVSFLEDQGYADWAFDPEGEERLWKESFAMVGLKEE